MAEVNTKEIIVPGEKLDLKVDSYTFKDQSGLYSMVFGVLDKKDGFGRIVPLTGKYFPQVEDYVVGIISEVKFGGYVIDINSPYEAFLQSRKRYNHGDVIFAKIMEVNEVRRSVLSHDKSLFGGDILEISPVRVPRVIGKKNSMMMLITEKTKTELCIGRNGRIWIHGGDEKKAKEAILKIEREAHTDGLTERMTEFLSR
jgi:exosome complex component RRP4